MAEETAIIRVLVYPDDNVPECMDGIYRVGGVEIWKTGGIIEYNKELVDNKEFHSTGEMLEHVAQYLKVDLSIVELDGP